MKKVLAIILAVVLVASIGAFIYTGKDDKPQTDTLVVEETEDFSLATSEYTQSLNIVGAGGEIYLPTYIENLFYTADLKGNIAFYDYNAGEFNLSVEAIETVSVNMTISKDSIPVRINFMERNGQKVGYGVYTSDNGGSDYFDYAFVQLRNKPEGYGNGYLLLTDYDKEDFYKANKVYNEIYEYDLSAKNVSVKYSQNTRLIDKNGTYRQDWAMLSDEFIANIGNKKYFMSSRYYNQSETGKRTDIMVYSSAYRPEIVTKDIVGEWYVIDADGAHYMKTTDDGFKAVCKAEGDKKAKDVAKFTGDFFNDYLYSGNYVINKQTREITNLLNGQKGQFNADISKAIAVSVNKDGTKAVFVFETQENANKVPVQTIVYASTNGETKIYSEPLIYSEQSSFIWLDNDQCMSARAINENGEEIGSVIYNFTTA